MHGPHRPRVSYCRYIEHLMENIVYVVVVGNRLSLALEPGYSVLYISFDRSNTSMVFNKLVLFYM